MTRFPLRLTPEARFSPPASWLRATVERESRPEFGLRETPPETDESWRDWAREPGRGLEGREG